MKSGVVVGTLDHRSIQVARGQRRMRVRAKVINCEQFSARSKNADRAVGALYLNGPVIGI